MDVKVPVVAARTFIAARTFMVRVIVVVVMAVIFGVAEYCFPDKSKSPASVAVAPDPRDQQIADLSAKVEALGKQKVEHHYELRNEGVRSFRFDPATGESCIQLTTKEDWKQPRTIRQGCQYNDYIAAHAGMISTGMEVECWFVGNKEACSHLDKNDSLGIR